MPEPVRVAVLSGESGAASLQETARRVCAAKGVNLSGCDILWQTDLPRLSDPGDRDRLRDGLATAAVRVAVVDPLYLCLLGGLEKASASNLYEVGPLLRDAARACLDAGATPVLVHHATKGAGQKAGGSGPPELDDLAFAGIGEFARQWLLVNRREPYRPGTGSHALNLAVGGSAGHSSHWHLDVQETAGTARGWRVELSAADQTPTVTLSKRVAGAKPSAHPALDQY